MFFGTIIAAFMIGLLFAIPFVLTIRNIIEFINLLNKKEEKSYVKFHEIFGIVLGFIYTHLYSAYADIKFVTWDTQLYNYEAHGYLAPESLPTIYTILAVAFISYLIIRFIPAEKLSPVVSAFAISGIYLGAAICILLILQTGTNFFLLLLPANCLLICYKTVYSFVQKKKALIENGAVSTKYKGMLAILNSAEKLPSAALIFTIPLLGAIIILLYLFGQEPDSIIKAWTETSGWGLSQRIAPPNIGMDEHYLCTVAAQGHDNIVKPLRMGIRHGHVVTVNRQLCIANAFEQVLSEKLPAFHRIIRKLYDRYGYPLSRHIKTKLAADIVYYLMKPLEWAFLIVLYTTDINPENRIAVQYPHSPVPFN